MSRQVFSSIQRTVWINRDSYDQPGSSGWHMSRRSREGNAEALRIRRGLVKVAPDSIIALTELFIVYLQAFLEGWWETPDDILAEMDRVSDACLAVDSRSSQCQWLSGLSHLWSGRRVKAIAFEQALEAGSGSPFMQGQLGFALATVGESEQALVSISQAMALSPEDDLVTDWRLYEGIAYFAAGDYEKAREAALKCVQSNANTLNNRIASGYQLLAASNAHLGLMNEAQEALQEAKRLRPELRGQMVEVAFSSAEPGHRQRYLEGLRMAGLKD